VKDAVNDEREEDEVATGGGRSGQKLVHEFDV